MKLLKTLVAIVLLALWLPAQSHCLLERVGWLWTSDCCVDGEGAPVNPTGLPCSEKTCCNLDTPTYKVGQTRPLSGAPLTLASGLALADETGPPVHQGFVPVEPPPSAVIWSFLLRAAAPPRAPCLTS